MANGLYDKGRDAFANKLIDWVNDDIRVLVTTSGYTANLGTNQYVSDVTNILARSSALTGKSTSAGVCAAANASVTPSNGDIIGRIVVYQYNASDSAARLIAYWDTASGMPWTCDGTAVSITWDTGTNKVFKL